MTTLCEQFDALRKKHPYPRLADVAIVAVVLCVLHGKLDHVSLVLLGVATTVYLFPYFEPVLRRITRFNLFGSGVDIGPDTKRLAESAGEVNAKRVPSTRERAFAQVVNIVFDELAPRERLFQAQLYIERVLRNYLREHQTAIADDAPLIVCVGRMLENGFIDRDEAALFTQFIAIRAKVSRASTDDEINYWDVERTVAIIIQFVIRFDRELEEDDQQADDTSETHS